MVEVNAFPHEGKELTGKLMYYLTESFCDDLGPSRFQSLRSWFSEVKNIPYKSDDELFPTRPNEVIEVVARPKYLLNRKMWPAIDCKKKAMLIGAWAACNAVPFVFVAVAEYPLRDIHHVLPLLFVGGKWINADATLPEYSLGQEFNFTKAEELPR